MPKFRFWFLIFILLFIAPAYVYAQPYLCGSTGFVYSDSNFCNSACGSACQDLTAASTGTSYTCPSSGYEGFVYDPNTGYTYGVTTNTGFWTSFNATSNDPSLAVIPDAATNQLLTSILTNYNISSAWIGAYDSSMSTTYNTVDPQNYVWWNNNAISYSNWASGQPNNVLDSQDIGLVPTQGNHWAYMSSNGSWSADGYHYNYPSSQNYAPYYNALVQWNGPLSCVNGVTPASAPITSPDITNTVNQYCNGQNPCYMCTDTSQCTPQNECLSGYTYNSTNNDCEAAPTCPTGGSLTNGNCVASPGIACPNNYTYNSKNNDCEANANPSCNDSGTVSNNQCVLTPNEGCNAYYGYKSTNNDCEANASAQCANGGSAEDVGGQTMCQLSPTYTCADSSYAYGTLVAGQCAADANIQCPTGGSFSGGQCISQTSPCPTGYTLNGGLCTAPATITCAGSGKYSETYGVCIESSQNTCPSGFTFNSSVDYCEGTPTGYTCPGSGIYNPSENMCSENVVQGCPTGYSLVNNQCVSQISYNCPLPGSYNSVESMCSTAVTSYNCPSGYTYTNNTCEASLSCASNGSYNTAENACSTPLQPCSPTSQNMQQCTQTSSGWLCPLGSAVCAVSGSNNFTNGGVISPTASGNSISTVASGVNNGYMSFYNYQANLPAGTYTINMSADDDGWFYADGSSIGTTSSSGTSSTTYTSSGGLTNFFIAVMNNCPSCSDSGNFTDAYLSVVNSSGTTVLTTSTNWQASLNPSNFGFNATCPSGYNWSETYNACVVSVSQSCPSGFTLSGSGSSAKCTAPPSACPSGSTLSGGQCIASPSCPSGTSISGNQCVASPSYYCPSGYWLSGTTCTTATSAGVSCPSGTGYNGSQCVGSPSYYCPSGYSLSGTTCTSTVSAGSYCPSGSYSGGECVATYCGYSCPAGTILEDDWCYPSTGCQVCQSYPPTYTCSTYVVSSPVYYCPSGYSLSGTTCYRTVSASVSCPSGTGYNGSQCVGSPSYYCPSGYWLSGTTCYNSTSAGVSCPSGTGYNGSQCISSVNCPSGTSYNGSQCSSTPSCPSGSTFNGSQCVISVTNSCPSGSSYSTADNFCYIAPSISFGETCPVGNYQCMPNSNGGYSCSKFTCSNANSVTQEPAPTPTNITNNGQVTNQGCQGSIYIFNGQTFDCRESGIEDGFANCCSSAKDWIGMGKCWQNEVAFQQKKEAKFCHEVGTFCTAKFLGVCLQKDQAWCCFSGVLARIIQEQGRLQSLPQLGWGTPENPGCEGFTPTQFQQLDWSKINLSEYFAYIQQQFIPAIQQNINNGINNAVNKLQQGYSGE